METTFDIEEVITQMLDALKGELKKDWPAAKAYMEEFARRQKLLLETEALMRITGELTDAEYASRLDDNKQLMGVQLEAIKSVSKAMAQKAANAAIQVLEKAVGIALKGLI